MFNPTLTTQKHAASNGAGILQVKGSVDCIYQSPRFWNEDAENLGG